jgi:4-hydroxy-tetrahydrodipicolinate synthase
MSTIARFVPRFSGYAPALPTPFTPEGRVDRPAFEGFCALQIEAGATALVACGTTGEAPTLTPAEQRDVVTCAVKAAQGRVPVIAGAGSNATARAIELTRTAEACGADAILSVVPYYNRPTQDGLYAHFRAVADSTGLPVILYDVPARTVCGLADETVAQLSRLPNVLGLKDATGDVTRPSRLRPMVGPRFRLLSGDDATAIDFLLRGGNGCISVTSNVAPGLCRSLYQACRNGQLARARKLAETLARLSAVLFRESNPAPLKYALSLMGLMSSAVRLPLVGPGEQTRAEILAAVNSLAERYADDVVGRLPRNGIDAHAAHA